MRQLKQRTSQRSAALSENLSIPAVLFQCFRLNFRRFLCRFSRVVTYAVSYFPGLKFDHLWSILENKRSLQELENKLGESCAGLCQ